MKCIAPEMSWHNRDPVLSIDVQAGFYTSPKGAKFWRVATAGADTHVLIWHFLKTEAGRISMVCVADLERHQKAVNVVRFSPSKEILASADDESVIILWRLKEDLETSISPEEVETKEQWVSWKVLRGHLADVYDISWSPDSNSMVSGSVDNSAILWDIQKGRSSAILSDYKGFVQGVSWDPCNEYICTIGSEGLCRLIDINTVETTKKVYKCKVPMPADHALKNNVLCTFYEDTFPSFFRRLTFSLDGKLIFVPSGIIERIENHDKERICYATIVFHRYNFKNPVMVLTSIDEYTVAVRCCPIYFELRKDGPTPVIDLPYRMIFAVATQRSVLIYDTQQTTPIAVISNIHMTTLTDVAWSSDGRILVTSSTDGYCSITCFEENELGREYKKGENATTLSSKITLQESLNERTNEMGNISLEKQTERKYDDGETNTTKREDKSGMEESEETEDIILIYDEESEIGPSGTRNRDAMDSGQLGKKSAENNDNKTPPKTDRSTIMPSKTPRRVKLITLSSPKATKKG